MNLNKKLSHYSLFLLRVSLGWVFLYAGISKITNPSWSASGYLTKATTFPSFFEKLTDPSVIHIINIANEWGLFLIGAGLIVGLFTRWASFFGIILMILYYLPILDFPKVGNGFLVDEHIIYIMVLLLIATSRAGNYIGLDKLRKKNS